MKKLIYVFICLFLTIPCQARIIYVDADATGANTGSSWADAYNYLQDALSEANSNSDVNEIRVAQGIYKPTGPVPPPVNSPTSASNSEDVGVTAGDRTATFQLINGVAIKGGYAGFGQPDPNARDIEVYETVLSGDLLGNDGPGFANNGENSYHVVTSSGTNETAVLDGFTITAGNASDSGINNYGGGMYNRSSSPTLTNCTFSENSAYYCGGGMYNFSGSPTLTNCTFSGNWTDYGGGMYNYNSSPTVTNCTFSKNSTYYYGGGMSNYRSSSPKLTNCTFSGNSADWDGGGMFNYWSSPAVTNCTFTDNSAVSYGGGMYNNESSPILTNCTFAGNSATHGVALACDSYQQQGPSNIQVTNCILWDGGNEILNNDNSSIPITYSDIQGGWPGEGNIDADPCFVEPDYLGPISHWKFDEGDGTIAYDSAGNNHGTLVNGPTWTTGQVGGALSFNDNWDYVDCGNDSSLDISDNMTISLWFYSEGWAPPHGYNGLISKRDDFYVCLDWEIYYDRNHTEIRLYDGSVVTFDNLHVNPSLNRWHHLAITKNGTTATFYLDGISQGTDTTSNSWDIEASVRIGTIGIDRLDCGFNGTIDEVMIFNRVLSAEEIQQLYHNGLRGEDYPDSAGPDYHLLADSPCINAGDPNYVAEPNETDLDGKPRVIGGRIDMGVYEFNHIPVADAGPNQTAYAWIDGIAEVILDGTNSYDEDGQPLTYNWSWAVDSNSFTATEAVSIIELPVGEHIIELIVNDGIDDSEPNEVVITVVPPMESQLWIVPRVINRRSRQPVILALLRLPEDVTKDQVDSDQPLLLYPGGIEAIRQYVIQSRRRRAEQVSILALFDKDELINAIPDEGSVELQVVGRLKTGQYFYGSDTVRIIRRHRRPTGGSGDNRRVTVPLNR